MNRDGRISEDDRERMRRVGEVIAEANTESLLGHVALTGVERLARSELLAKSTRGWANVRSREHDEPWRLLELARERGLLGPE